MDLTLQFSGRYHCLLFTNSNGPCEKENKNHLQTPRPWWVNKVILRRKYLVSNPFEPHLIFQKRFHSIIIYTQMNPFMINVAIRKPFNIFWFNIWVKANHFSYRKWVSHRAKCVEFMLLYKTSTLVSAELQCGGFERGRNNVIWLSAWPLLQIYIHHHPEKQRTAP